MKKSATPEQQAQAAERRAKFRKLAHDIGAMPADKRAELARSLPVVATVEGRTLSATNTMLVVMQCQSATIVGGFRQWLKAGRVVRKGEHGISIWIPSGTKAENDAQPDDVHFLMGTVFNVSQTDVFTGQRDEPETMPAHQIPQDSAFEPSHFQG